MNREINYTIAAAGILAIASSSLNYFINEDIISLGIFSFAGLGFILLSIKPAEHQSEKQKNQSARLKNISYFMFSISVLIFCYWLIVGKLKLI